MGWTEVLVEAKGRPLLWLTADDDGYALLNIDLYDESGNVRLEMRDNDWITYGELADLECPPGGNSLFISTPSLRTNLRVSFRNTDPDNLRARALQISMATRHSVYTEAEAQAEAERVVGRLMPLLSGDDLVLCEITGSLEWPYPITFGSTGLILPGGISLTHVMGGRDTKRGVVVT